MKWREGDGGPSLRTVLGRVIARVTYTGSLWRGTVWTRAGTSSATWGTLKEAMAWCEGELA
jgi:hypothetical protein